MNHTIKGLVRAVLIMALGLAGAHSAWAEPVLEDQFLHPPDSARPWVYWFWMDGNSSREGITADLEDMQRVGIGGALLLEVDCGVPKGPVRFMTPEWRELFKHAVREADRLGLQINLNAGPGWTGNGGPWIKPEQSMKKVTFSETTVTGPQHFDAMLAQPPTKADFYRDIAVLALPTPQSEYRIPRINEQAMFYRNWYWAPPGSPTHLSTEIGAPAPPEAAVPVERIVDLTTSLSPEGRLAWEVPAGDWTIIRFGQTSTGANTIPAPAPGVGLECDKLDAAALETHLAAHTSALADAVGPLAGKSLTMIHLDSWEIGPQNWTQRFPEEFQRRRGYDLRPYLPVMTGRVVGNLEISVRFLWDVRQTISELIIENNGRKLAEFARQRGMQFSLQAYDGTPCADLSFGATCDVPMCEFWTTFASWFTAFEAASIAHTNGRPIVEAEAFTSDLHERWRYHPGSIKALGDWAFCQGVNRFVVHRYTHQPWLDRFPGMTMGPWGLHFERTQTWWDMVPAFLTYVSRCQYVLQQGTPVVDICYLVPEGAPCIFRPPSSAVRGDPPDHFRYTFDACAPEIVLSRLRVQDGRLVLPDGMSYRVLVLPEMPTMTPELLRKLAELIRDGATVVGSPPQRSPSLAGYPQCDAEVQRLATEIWGSESATEQSPMRRYGRGYVYRTPRSALEAPAQPEVPASAPAIAPAEVMIDANHAPAGLYVDFGRIETVLHALGTLPDFDSSAEFSFVHRRIGDADVYFVANRSTQRRGAVCQFRVTGRVPTLWDPMSGRVTRPVAYQQDESGTGVPLWLEPAGSVFVVFKPPTGEADSSPDPIVTVTRDGKSVLPSVHSVSTERPALEPLATRDGALGPTALLAWRAGQYETRTARGRTRSFTVSELPQPIALGGPWDVQFQPQRGAPEKVTLDMLIDWAKHPDAGVRHFSGRAIYRLEFSIDAAQLSADRRWFLDLGRVEVAAQVSLNGQSLGTLWKVPFRLDVTQTAKAGTNTLEVTVANLWCNRLIGDAGLSAEQRVAWTTWNPFKPDDPLLPSGLLGPVRLVPATVHDVR